jgi:hypothetical protein
MSILEYYRLKTNEQNQREEERKHHNKAVMDSILIFNEDGKISTYKKHLDNLHLQMSAEKPVNTTSFKD